MEQKGGVLKNHVAGEPGKEFLTNCPASNQGPDCIRWPAACFDDIDALAS